MRNMGKLKVTTPSEHEIVMTRDFNAPRSLVFDCWTKPELVRRWLLGPAGWSMPVCQIDLRVGGAYRFEWRHVLNGAEMAMGGIYHEIARPDRLVCTESFDEKWYTRRRARHDGVHRTKRHDDAGADHTLRIRQARDMALSLGDGERRHRQFRPARRVCWHREPSRQAPRRRACLPHSHHQKIHHQEIEMQKITPFLWFDNQAEEAMNFYVSIFKNSKVGNVSRYGDAGPGPKGSVMVASFELDGRSSRR